jgi:hypothetical protein
MMKLFWLLVCAGALEAQPVSFGVKGGVRLTGDLDSYWAESESQRYVVGPMVTVALPLKFRLEFDALYRRVGFRSGNADGFGDVYAERDRGNSWEFPIVVRHTFWRGVYAGVGYAPRVINGSSHIESTSVRSINPVIRTYSEYTLPGSWETTHGVVAAAGFEKRVRPVWVAPEVRYVHWNKPAVDVYGSHGFSIQSTQDQADVMVGIRFP